MSTEAEGSVVTERGVKVKWPAKRMSVADMNKRVRSLVESVGREQAGALDRERRKVSLARKLAVQDAELDAATAENAEKTPMATDADRITNGHLTNGKTTMVKDNVSTDMDVDTAAIEDVTKLSTHSLEIPSVVKALQNGNMSNSAVAEVLLSETTSDSRQLTMKMMEELMEELIGFQERFGPGAKGRTRERLSKVVS